MADFIPRRDADVLDFTRNFSKQIQQDPARFGLTAKQAADYAALQVDYAAAYLASQDPMTRGVRTVMVKDRTRKALTRQTRELARIVRAQPGVSRLALVVLGLVRSSGGGAAEVEQVRGPSVRVRADSRRVEVVLRTWAMERKRPSGAVGVAVYWAVGEDYPQTLEGYTLAGNTTKSEMAFTLPADVAPPGTRVWVTACWLDARLQPGKAEIPVSARVGFGYLMKAA